MSKDHLPQEKGVWRTSSHEQGMRLHSFLKAKLPSHYSTKMIKRAIDNKACFVNGKIEFISTYRLSLEDKIEFFYGRALTEPKKERAPFKMLFDNEALAIVQKPVGFICEPQAVKEHFGADYELVHRLDKETSGALILAKNPASKRAVEDLFAKRGVLKSYLAIVEGVPKQKRGVIENELGKKASYEGQTIWGVVGKGRGLFASTEWELLATNGKISLLKVFPKTGRTHQIRVHLHSIGLPILGDYQYARNFSSSFEIDRHMLHAYQIAFELKGERIECTAPVPGDMGKLIKENKWLSQKKEMPRAS